jgi:hypothetical protein
MRAETFRYELKRLLRHQPFEKLIIAFDGGDKVIVEHPENVAFDPTPGSGHRVFIVGGSALRYSTLDAISTILQVDKIDMIPDSELAAA